LIKSYPDTLFSCLVDNSAAAQYLSDQAQQAQVVIAVYVDLNVGMNRTGVLPDDRALALYMFCAALPGITPVGWHVYDGHITDTDLAVRTEKCNAAFAPVGRLCEALVEKGFATPVVVAGGSATFPIHAKRQGVECSPGTFIYWDAGYEQLLPEQPFLPAALVLTRIISLPGGKRICTDLGHKSVASENMLSRRVRFINAPELNVISQSEEHLVLEGGENHPYRIGDVLYGLPYHICPTCALYERAFVVEDKTATTAWKIIARDRKLLT
jgi:D-serine deaminase-like pyridoxal phosphate-dependent protein